MNLLAVWGIAAQSSHLVVHHEHRGRYDSGTIVHSIAEMNDEWGVWGGEREGDGGECVESVGRGEGGEWGV